MKHKYLKTKAMALFGALFCSSVALGADFPTSTTLSGAAIDETEPVACTKIADGIFEAYVSLKANEPLAIEANSGTWELSGNTTATTDGVYCVTVDYTNSTKRIDAVESVNLYYGWDKLRFPLEYIGSGCFKGTFDCPGGDSRYRIIAVVAGQDVHFGPTTDGLDWAPSKTTLGDEYFKMKHISTFDQWSPAWKFESSQQGRQQEVTVKLRGEYTHSYTKVETPQSLTVQGSALVESPAPEFTKIDDVAFELFTELQPGELTISDGTSSYKVVGKGFEKSAEPNAIASAGIYSISLNFQTGEAAIAPVNSFAIKHCWTGKEYMLEYMGAGTWAGSFSYNHSDNRYQFIMNIGGSSMKWGPTDTGIDWTPNGSDTYYNMKRAPQATQWDPKWKFEDKYRNGDSYLVVATMRGVFTHSFHDMGTIPATVAISGTALAEARSYQMTQVGEGTFELFTKLQAGNLSFSDGTTSYAIVNGRVQPADVPTTVAEEGVYCIYLDFATGAAYIKPVDSFHFVHCWNGKLAELAYKGNSTWSGVVELPSNDDRYKFEMVIGGTPQQWGPTTAGLDKRPSEMGLGEEYYCMQRVSSSQWDNKWKYEQEQKGTSQQVTVTLAGKYSHTLTEAAGIGAVAAEKAFTVMVSGQNVVANLDATVYSVSGGVVATVTAGKEHTLAPGFYIVASVHAATKIIVK